MHWIRTQNNILLTADSLIRVEMEPQRPQNLAAYPNEPWIIKAYFSPKKDNSSYGFQVLLIQPNIEETSYILICSLNG